jgi:hypothetical protein
MAEATAGARFEYPGLLLCLQGQKDRIIRANPFSEMHPADRLILTYEAQVENVAVARAAVAELGEALGMEEPALGDLRRSSPRPARTSSVTPILTGWAGSRSRPSPTTGC